MAIGDCSLSKGFVYQFPVCVRDFAFYLAMMAGGFLILLLKKENESKIPNLIFLFIFILPLAVDGITQLLGLRESNNQLRIITGFLAGIIVPFYLIPIMNRVFSKGRENGRKLSKI
ncbi:MAG: DUF2085 domain-containing protein [Candidatus Micrarchaeota archaeon]|nr:DUF2085 domain-containing protein [Candidatus Micrarchaeota archaeon]